MDTLPLREVIAGEKKGGWGRSIRGANQVLSKYMKNGDTKDLGLQLSAHLELVHIARSMQAANIPAIDSEENVGMMADRLKKAGVELPEAVQVALVYRKMSILRKSLSEDASDTNA